MNIQARTPDKIREDIGMNLACELKALDFPVRFIYIYIYIYISTIYIYIYIYVSICCGFIGMNLACELKALVLFVAGDFLQSVLLSCFVSKFPAFSLTLINLSNAFCFSVFLLKFQNPKT